MRPDDSLCAAYFDGIFAGDRDPWSLESSPYERAKFDHTIAVLSDRHHAHALEVGCAQGMLTRRLAPLCDDLLAIDISATALERAAQRCRELTQVRFARMAFPREYPDERFDLILLSEVVYYWSDADIALAATRIAAITSPDARLLLVHFTGDTDYPQSGDEAVRKLRARLDTAVERNERYDRYRLDLWRMR